MKRRRRGSRNLKGALNVNASAQPAYVPSWNTATMLAAPDRAPLIGDLDVEVCVVGAGLAGLTVARELARRSLSVVVLEARRIAWNASGRNTGFLLPGFAQSMDVVVRRVGLDHAKALWHLSEAGVGYVRKAIHENSIRGVELIDGGWLKVSKADDAMHDRALFNLLAEDFGADVEFWPVDQLRAVLQSNHYFHAIHYPRACHMHALNYALGLATAAELTGARIFEATPVLSMDADGVRKRIETPSGRVRAAHVVLAGNVHLGQVMPRIAGTLVPVWTYVATTAPLGARLGEAINFRGAVSDTDLADNHYKIVGGDRLMWSGGMTTSERDPSQFAGQLKGDIHDVYPQLGEVEFEYIWTGVLGNTVHRMPQIGELSPQLWLASGFGGHGLNTTAMAGEVIARAIADGDDTWKLFLPFELVWAGDRIGRAVAQVHYWWYRRSEQAKGRESRKREAVERRTQAHAVNPAWEQHEVEAGPARALASAPSTPSPAVATSAATDQTPALPDRTAEHVSADAQPSSEEDAAARAVADPESPRGEHDWQKLLDPRQRR